MTTPAQKVAIITGASQGIGAGLVAAYRKHGYAVVANARTFGQSDDPNIIGVAGDVADPATGAHLVAAAVDRFTRVDTLVNNAGVFIAKPFTEYTAQDYELVTRVNLHGFFNVTQPAVAQMLAQRQGGHIVNVTTTLVEYANVEVPSALASLTKGGLAAVTKSLAIEYAARGIRVNAVSPGTIKTPMHSADNYEALARLHPLGRVGDVEDVVRGVMYLESASFVTGEFLHVDGGQSAGH